MVSRVLVFGMTDKRGGVESFIMNATGMIDPSRVSFDYIVNTDVVAYEEELAGRGSKIIHVPMRAKHPIAFTRVVDRFFSENAHKYDAIWVNVCSLANIDYLRYAKKYGIPKRIIHCHNSQNMDSKLRGMLHEHNKKRITEYATDYWSCSDEASAWFYGDAIRNLSTYKVINNAIDPQKFAFNRTIREKMRESLKIDDAFLIGNVGRLHKQKNQCFLIDAFRLLHEHIPNARLVIAGQGELRGQLQKKIDDCGLNEEIILLGELTNTADFYQALDLFAFPSLYEGLSIALLEAQANGLPSIISTGNPQNAVVNSNVHRIAIDDAAKWADLMRHELTHEGRIQTSENRIIGSDFDINTQSSFMETFFEKAGKRV